MIRLILPLLLLTALFWTVIWALPKKERRAGLSHAKHFVIAFALAAASLVAISAVVYFLTGSFINA